MNITIAEIANLPGICARGATIATNLFGSEPVAISDAARSYYDATSDIGAIARALMAVSIAQNISTRSWLESLVTLALDAASSAKAEAVKAKENLVKWSGHYSVEAETAMERATALQFVAWDAAKASEEAAQAATRAAEYADRAASMAWESMEAANEAAMATKRAASIDKAAVIAILFAAIDAL